MISRRRWRAHTRWIRPLLLLTSINIVVFAFTAGPAIAKAVSVSGGLSLGLANSLYCALTGCTMTGGVTFSGVATDITGGTNEDITVQPNGTGAANLFSSNGNGLQVSKNNTSAQLVFRPSGVATADIIQFGTSGNTFFRLDSVAKPHFPITVQHDLSAINTCNAAAEGTVQADNTSGVSTAHRTRLCLCTSNGSATYAWQNLASATVGTSSTCSD